ncbi:outer membrane beta-barrel family protein [Hymenobacter cellulosilyticus]|uniref:TonB-dependent receptor n=1 Tax=Hymenobacter cellulosilyticus TaxID=2932248 RepID=A0A8T9QAV3_9BACT|nr:outer membrane beta-barrel family protein [Hymenobacter cellulosilyticus]UOQ74142.1 TonB-dependent receptor [Hymenobacter cellulosilyticus]
MFKSLTRSWRPALPLLFVLLGMAGVARAQLAGTVRGTLLDAVSSQPVPFANVVLLRAQDSSFVAGAQTTEAGAFVLEQVAPGNYTLRATVLGYRAGRKQVSVTAAAPTVQLGTLRLRPTATQLQDVVVQGERQVVVNNLDKKVINVSKDLTSVGGTASDVLQNVPSVTVDQNGSVSLRGSSNVTIYIDGKPSGAAGGGRATSLDQIPASQIESVEVITNPSARYDAEGATGIMNIVLKKERNEGWNGLATVNVGTKDKYNTSLSLNYHKGKFNVFSSYDFRQDRRTGYGSLDQKTTTTNSTTGRAETLQLLQNRSGVGYNTSHAVRVGVDYNLTPTQTLTFSVQPRLNRSSSIDDILARQTNLAENTPVALGTSNRYNNGAGHNRSADLSLDYRRTWEGQKGRELTASAVYTPISSRNTIGSRLYYLTDGSTTEQQQEFKNQVNQASGQVDYVHPVGEKGRVETGAKSVLRQYDNTYLFRSSAPLKFDPSNHFLYQEYIQAAYGNFSNAVGNLSYQAGLRVEQTNTHGNQLSTGEQFRRSYLNLFPSAVLTYDVSKEQQVRLSYSRRVQRPDQGELNPFTDRSDQLNLRTGNPLLLPEYIHSLELGNQRFFGANSSVTATAFYSLETQTIKDFRQVLIDPLTGNQVTSSTRLNLGDETNYGLELVGSTTLTPIWKLNANASGFRRIIKGSGPSTDINNSNFVYTARLNTTVSPTKKLDFQVSVNYRSPVVTAQGRRQTAFNTDFAAKQTVLKDRGTISLRVSDVFNTLRFNFDAYGPGLDAVSRNKRESRIAFLGFTYRFGNSKQEPQRKRPDHTQDSGGSGFE